jgi:hypothetical protein
LNPANSEPQDHSRKWMWCFLATLLALQLYFVRELLAALFLFALGFGALAGLALFLFLVERAGQFSMAWAGSHTRRGLGLLGEISKKPFRGPRSEPAQ